MIKKLILILIFVNFSFANFTKNEYIKKDLEVLKDLNLYKTFIKDEDLKAIFLKYGGKSHLKHYVKNIKDAEVYVSLVRRIIKKEGLPSSFLFLPMTESNFKMKSASGSSPAGLWQFIPSTAKIYNLKDNKYIDERLDVVKSTKAASKYLKKHHKKFKKWYLAILAYNCGEGRIIEAITRLKIDAYLKKYPKKANDKTIKKYLAIIDDYIDKGKGFYRINKIYKKVRNWKVQIDINKLLLKDEKLQRQYIPQESRTYLRKIVAFSFLANRNFYQKKDLFKADKNFIVAVKGKSGMHLKSLAKLIDMPYSKLTKLNLHLKKKILPKNVKNYSLYIPKNKKKVYDRYKNRLKNISFEVHKVRKGDTLSSLGKRYNIRYGKIKKYNDLKTNNLSINQILIIPVKVKS